MACFLLGSTSIPVCLFRRRRRASRTICTSCEDVCDVIFALSHLSSNRLAVAAMHLTSLLCAARHRLFMRTATNSNQHRPAPHSASVKAVGRERRKTRPVVARGRQYETHVRRQRGNTPFWVKQREVPHSAETKREAPPGGP